LGGRAGRERLGYEEPAQSGAVTAFLKIPLERLSLLCHNVATCLSAGLTVPAGLGASVRSSVDAPLNGIVEASAVKIAIVLSMLTGAGLQIIAFGPAR